MHARTSADRVTRAQSLWTSGSHARSSSAACANLSPQGPDSALKWRSMQTRKRPPPALTSPQERLMALSQVLSEEPKRATLWVVAPTVTMSAVAKTRARETCLMGDTLFFFAIGPRAASREHAAPLSRRNREECAQVASSQHAS